MNTSEKVSLPMSKKELRKTLDEAVDESCLRFYKVFRERPQIELDKDKGELMDPMAEEYESALQGLAFICDARAQVDNDEYNIVNNVAWAGVARTGFKRMSRKMKGTTRGMHGLSEFVDEDITLPMATYEDMCAHRNQTNSGAAIGDHGPAYAAQVALGEIVF